MLLAVFVLKKLVESACAWARAFGESGCNKYVVNRILPNNFL